MTYVKVTTRMPTGAIEQTCSGCGKKVVGGNVSKKYKTSCTFVHSYRDIQCTKWLDTEIFHVDCWPEELKSREVIVATVDGKQLASA